MLTRRKFLSHGAVGFSAVALGGAMPALFARAAEASAKSDRDDRILVVVELSGGNDGLNTVVPFEDDLYYRYRRTLGIPKDQVHRLSDQVGFHPQLEPLSGLFKDGKLSIVQGVGYPEPDRSHFRSMEIWHTASVEQRPPTAGWLGRYLDQQKATDKALLPGLALTGSLPQALQADQIVVPVVASLESLGNDGAPSAQVVRKLSTAPKAGDGPVAFMRAQAESAYRAAEQLREAGNKYHSSMTYPGSDLGNQLRRAAQIISGDLGTRVLFASQGGYDTHAGQADPHAGLLGDLAASLAAFQQDLEALNVADRVVTFVFSEFGRRVDENSSAGTDHGAASCLFLMGTKVKGGLAGAYPTLAKLGDGDLIFTIDFRSVYASLLDRWLAAPSETLLKAKFAPLDIV